MSFRREAHVPHGGPDGGDGGHGGDVVLVCDDSLRDLQTYKRRAHYKATRAGHGEGDLRHGANGPVLEIPVPPGTQVTSWDGSTHDLVVPGQRVVVARGGSGGRGNKHFATSTRQAPRLRERGLRRRGGLARAAAEAARRRRPRRRAERRQVVAAGAHDARRAEGRRLPVHDARARARHARGRRPPARHRRHPRPHRGRQRRRRASATTSSRTSSARACSCTCSTSSPRTARTRWTTTRRSRPSCAPTTRGWRRCRACSRCRRPTSCRRGRRGRRRAVARAPRRRGARCS